MTVSRFQSSPGMRVTYYIICQGGLVSWYPLSLLFVKETSFLPGRGIIARSLRAHLSGAFEANNHISYTL